ncbi:MAG: polymerase subunit delta, partial [Candidatus Hydrogenedentes bacterium]|nr:polymerase subunit delta [Candidatus Hydrogenedentota bacterium]
LAEIGKKPPAPVYLMCPHKGPRAKNATFEPLLADRIVDRFIATYVDPSLRDLTYSAVYADETKPGEIVLEAQTLPFLAERRVILVRNAERYISETAAGAMLDYLASPCDTTLMLLVASQVDKRTRFYKVCEKNAVIVECPALNEREVPGWARNEVTNRGKRIESAAADELAQRAGTRLNDVLNAINVVCDYVGDAQVVRVEDVVAACADVAEQEVWALTDAIAISDTSKALAALRKLIDLGKQPDEILGIVNWLLKTAYGVSVSSGKGSAYSYAADKVAPLANKLGESKLRAAFALCTDTHFMIRSTGVDSELALELLTVKLAMPRKKSADQSA